MTQNTELQSQPNTKERWVTPELTSLSVKETLNGLVPLPGEFSYLDVAHDTLQFS